MAHSVIPRKKQAQNALFTDWRGIVKINDATSMPPLSLIKGVCPASYARTYRFHRIIRK
jgi:hypothetical protein